MIPVVMTRDRQTGQRWAREGSGGERSKLVTIHLGAIVSAVEIRPQGRQ